MTDRERICTCSGTCAWMCGCRTCHTDRELIEAWLLCWENPGPPGTPRIVRAALEIIDAEHHADASQPDFCSCSFGPKRPCRDAAAHEAKLWKAING